MCIPCSNCVVHHETTNDHNNDKEYRVMHINVLMIFFPAVKYNDHTLVTKFTFTKGLF